MSSQPAQEQIVFTKGLDEYEAAHYHVTGDFDFDDNFFQDGEAMQECRIFPRDLRKTWPAWLQLTFHKYILFLDCVGLTRDTLGNNLNLARKFDAVVKGLQERAGMMYHFNRRFTIGGPGAHPQDIHALFEAVDFNEELDNPAALPKPLRDFFQPVAEAKADYMSTLVGSVPTTDWRAWRGLALTSASARTRSAARSRDSAYCYKLDTDSQVVLIERSLGPEAYSSKAKGTMWRILGFPTQSASGIDWIFNDPGKRLRTRQLGLSIENIGEVTREGGLLSEQGHKWLSVAEILHTLGLAEYWGGPNSRFQVKDCRKYSAINLEIGAMLERPM